MKKDKPSQAQIQRRNLVSSIFVTVLLGIAYQEMIAPARESFRQFGVTFELISLLGVFLLTGLRFFIGAQLHLVSDSLLTLGGKVWFFDFSIIFLEMLIMAFMGGVASPQASNLARIDFVDFLIVLLVIDILWVMAQWVMGRLWKSWRRSLVPWNWAILNLATVIILLISRAIIGDLYNLAGYIVLLSTNVFVFIIDVIFTDYYRLI